MTGRFVARVFYGGGNSVPVTGISGASGYRYLPLIPENQPFEASAIDTLTGETRSFEGVGPEIGQSTYMSFDFFSGENATTILSYDSSASGGYGDVDFYLFEGEAGDLVNLALFSERSPVASINFGVSGPDGQSTVDVLTSGGHIFETDLFELEQSGFYTVDGDGRQVSGNYTLGLAEIQPPTAVTPGTLSGNLDTLGERHYVFSGSSGQTLDYGLSHDASSALRGLLNVREFLSATTVHPGGAR